MSDIRVDPDVVMPPDVQVRHHALNEAARECYALRNAASRRGDADSAHAYLDMGDVYFGRALALSAEWQQ